jgi:hypothetical protein
MMEKLHKIYLDLQFKAGSLALNPPVIRVERTADDTGSSLDGIRKD